MKKPLIELDCLFMHDRWAEKINVDDEVEFVKVISRDGRIKEVCKKCAEKLIRSGLELYQN